MCGNEEWEHFYETGRVADYISYSQSMSAEQITAEARQGSEGVCYGGVSHINGNGSFLYADRRL